MTTVDLVGLHPVWDRLRDGLDSVVRTVADRGISIEEYVDDDRYVIRAELPGIDPKRDVCVSVYDGSLKIEVNRVDWHRREHTQFRYGAFSRTVDLPRRAVEETLRAAYENGVLEISVDVSPAPPISRMVPIATSHDGRTGPRACRRTPGRPKDLTDLDR